MSHGGAGRRWPRGIPDLGATGHAFRLEGSGSRIRSYRVLLKLVLGAEAPPSTRCSRHHWQHSGRLAEDTRDRVGAEYPLARWSRIFCTLSAQQELSMVENPDHPPGHLQASDEIVDARLWSGIHFGRVGEQGASIGRQIAHVPRVRDPLVPDTGSGSRRLTRRRSPPRRPQRSRIGVSKRPAENESVRLQVPRVLRAHEDRHLLVLVERKNRPCTYRDGSQLAHRRRVGLGLTGGRSAGGIRRNDHFDRLVMMQPEEAWPVVAWRSIAAGKHRRALGRSRDPPDRRAVQSPSSTPWMGRFGLPLWQRA